MPVNFADELVLLKFMANSKRKLAMNIYVAVNLGGSCSQLPPQRDGERV
jgi:hypothetical protein